MNPNEQPVSQKLLNEATDAILVGVKEMLDEMSAKMGARFETMETRLDNTDRKVDNLASRVVHLETRFDHMETRFDKVETKLEALATDVKAVKRQVSALERSTPKRDEFEALKSKVYRHSPVV